MNATPKETTEREAFEQAFADKLDFLRLSPDAEYFYSETGHAWDGWQARIAPSIPAQPGSGAAERIAHLEGEEEISEAVIGMMSRLLASIAITLKGEEAALKRHSYHDLADMVKVMALELDLYKTIYGDKVPEGWENGATPAPADSAAESVIDSEAMFKASADSVNRTWNAAYQAGKSDSAAERDTARYAWLRIDRAESAIPRVWQSSDNAEPVKCLHGDDLDAAIDAAIAAMRPKGNV